MRTAAIPALATLAFAAASAAADLPTPESVADAMTRANTYFMEKWPDPGREIRTGTTWPSNIWTRAVYYEGLMAFHAIQRDPKLLAYAERWGEAHAWGLRRGPTTRNADNQCAGQVYLELHAINPLPERIRDIQASAQAMLASDRADDWSWVDALQMAMPVFAKLGTLTGDERYFRKLRQLYDYSKTACGGRGLYNPEDRLWWRDADFLPPYREPNGEDCYWSRGNGWAFAAMARTLDALPRTHADRAEYEQMLRGMAEALAPLQRADGFWNVSLHDPTHFGGRELTGTALFVYGMAWGVRNGLLEPARFTPVASKAWNAMVRDGIHPDGRLGYVQSTGKEPKDGQPVTFEQIPDFEDFGLGCFLLAGSEMHRLARERK